MTAGARRAGESFGCHASRRRGPLAVLKELHAGSVCCGVQLFRRSPGRGGLGGVLLGLAEFGDGVGERGEAGD